MVACIFLHFGDFFSKFSRAAFYPLPAEEDESEFEPDSGVPRTLNEGIGGTRGW